MLRTLGAAAHRVQASPRNFPRWFSLGTCGLRATESLVLARRLFSLQYTLDPGVVVGLISAPFSWPGGTLATRRVVNTPPIQTLPTNEHAGALNASRTSSISQRSESDCANGSASMPHCRS